MLLGLNWNEDPDKFTPFLVPYPHTNPRLASLTTGIGTPNIE